VVEALVPAVGPDLLRLAREPVRLGLQGVGERQILKAPPHFVPVVGPCPRDRITQDGHESDPGELGRDAAGGERVEEVVGTGLPDGEGLSATTTGGHSCRKGTPVPDHPPTVVDIEVVGPFRPTGPDDTGMGRQGGEKCRAPTSLGPDEQKVRVGFRADASPRIQAQDPTPEARRVSFEIQLKLMLILS